MLDTEGGCMPAYGLWRHLKKNSYDVIEARTVLGCSRFYVLYLGIVYLPAIGEMTGVLTRVLIGSEIPLVSTPIVS